MNILPENLCVTNLRVIYALINFHLPSERGKVKPVDCPLVDERPRVLKKQWQNEAGKERTISVRSSCLQAWVAHHSILFFIPLNVS